jgi:hypothetical protein
MKYFTIAELCHSDVADRYGITNRCKSTHVLALTSLVETVLDPLREAYGKPIKVNSGFRTLELNQKLHGAKNSQHMLGQAADITGGSKEENKVLFDLIQKLGLPFDQLIDESNLTWIHVSHNHTVARQRGQILKLG